MNFRYYKFLILGFFLCALIFNFAQHAYASCLNPSGNEGKLVYSKSYHVLQFCNGSDWIAMGPITGGGDKTPDAFSFIDQTDIALSNLTVSNSITISNISTATNVIISGDGTPKFSIDGGAWVTTSTITNGQTLELRLTSNAVGSNLNSAIVTVGIVSDQWDVTTIAPSSGCTLPWSGTIEDSADVTAYQTSFVAYGASCVSETRSCSDGTLSGTYSNVACSPAAPADCTVTSETWLSNCTATVASATHGNNVVATIADPGGCGTAYYGSGTFACSNGTFSYGSGSCVQQTACDPTPNAFSFMDQTDVAISSVISSNSITIAGINTASTITISGAGSPQFRVNGGSWVTSGTITSGQTLELRLASNAANSMMNSATVTVGGVSDQWDVSTEAGVCSGSFSAGTFVSGDKCNFSTVLDSYSTVSYNHDDCASLCNATAGATCCDATITGFMLPLITVECSAGIGTIESGSGFHAQPSSCP